MKIMDYIQSYWVALRPFSLTLAFGSTSLGLLAGIRLGYINPAEPFQLLLIALVTIAGLASQAGANLINDYFEGTFKYPDPSQKTLRFLGRQRSRWDVLVFLSGLAVLGLAGLIGLYLVWLTDYRMLLIGLIGLFGSYAYTGEPFVYKRKGLGALLSFILMGILMPLGAWYPFTQTLSLWPVVYALPLSLLIPGLMLSNEIRDFQRDSRLSMGTLSVRIGRAWTLRLYDTLLIGSFILIAAYIWLKLYPWYAVAAAFGLYHAVRAWQAVHRGDRLSIPNTNKVHLILLTVTVGSLLLEYFITK